MTFDEILTHIYGLGRFGMKPGLEKIRSLLKALSDPQDSFDVIHVAGTNGKGSTSAFLASILAANGHKVGLFTSPHLIRFTERIRINGLEIAEKDVVSVAERVLSAASPGTTFFEIVTAMACLYFAEQGVGPAIMETGMGGRLDATNVASGILSLITPISLDHCEYLGDTIALIAREKAGVIKTGMPTVASRQSAEALSVLGEVCVDRHSPLYSFGSDFYSAWSESGLSYRGMQWQFADLKPGLPGSYQAENAATAIFAAEVLNNRGLALDAQAARRGVESAFWPGRMEMLGGAPGILLDGAHNPAGAAALAKALREVPRRRLILLVGVMANKDIDGILTSLAPLSDLVVTATPAIAKAFPSDRLASRIDAAGCKVIDGGTVQEGLRIAADAASPGDLILVSGSLFTVGEARAILLAKKFEPFRG